MNKIDAEVEQWVPIAEAAQLLGTTPLNMLMHIKRGLLIGVEQQCQWLVDPKSLVALIHRRNEEGVLAVCQSGCSKAHGCKSCG